jgi:ketosteroid isomerase-like protein
VPEQDLNDVIEGYREALRIYVRGDPEPALGFFSPNDDVTLANPFGPPRRGPAEIAAASREAAANFQEGGSLNFQDVASRFEEVSRYGTSELGYVVQLELMRAASRAATIRWLSRLRVTMIFRREAGGWKVVRRHADQIGTARSAETDIQS